MTFSELFANTLKKKKVLKSKVTLFTTIKNWNGPNVLSPVKGHVSHGSSIQWNINVQIDTNTCHSMD